MNWGLLAVINLYGCDRNFIRNKKIVKRFIKELCNLIDMERFGKAIVKKFGEGTLEGVSAIQFIKTSSITIHFDEQKNRAFIDLFSCKNFNGKKAEQFSKQFFKAKKSKMILIKRE